VIVLIGRFCIAHTLQYTVPNKGSSAPETV